MTIRVAAIEVSHWHSLFDAAYLRHLVAMPDVDLVAIQDSDAALVARRAAEVGSPPTFTDYRKMLATSRPDFVMALGRHRQMAGIANDLLDEGFPFLMEKPMGINAPEAESVAAKAARLGAFVAVPLAQRTGCSPSGHVSCSPRGASARCRTSMSGSTDRGRHATKPGIAPGCSIPPRPAVAASGTWARMGWTCSSI
jgi:Oxidoreductase family, NAD-binding Rossmann fold